MKTLSLLCLALLLAACGDATSATPTPGGAGASEPAPAAPEAPEAPAGLTVRTEPFTVGDVVPAFAGLPTAGKTIVVFYRGPW